MVDAFFVFQVMQRARTGKDKKYTEIPKFVRLVNGGFSSLYCTTNTVPNTKQKIYSQQQNTLTCPLGTYSDTDSPNSQACVHRPPLNQTNRASPHRCKRVNVQINETM